jgi:hypothetical protein
VAYLGYRFLFSRRSGDREIDRRFTDPMTRS